MLFWIINGARAKTITSRMHASQLNPILYMINAFRYGILGVSDIDIHLAFAIVILFIAALFGYSLWLLRRGVGIRT